MIKYDKVSYSNKVFQALGGSVVPPSKLHFSSPSISSARARPDFSSVKNFCLKSHVLPGEKTPICPWACSTSQAHACANGRVTGPWSTCFILIPELMLFPLAGLKQHQLLLTFPHKFQVMIGHLPFFGEKIESHRFKHGPVVASTYSVVADYHWLIETCPDLQSDSWAGESFPCLG